MEKNENYWNILQQVNDWVKYSETKASIILTVQGIIVTIIYSNSEAIYVAMDKSSILLYSSILISVLFILSAFFSFACVNPRLKNKNPTSIIYFGHIAKKFANFQDYYNNSNEIISNEDKLTNQLSEQIHVNSGIAWKKFVNVTWSLRFFVSSVIILMFTIIFYLISNIK